MPAEARITPIWRKQKLFVAVFLFAISGWFLWDGKVGWPRSNERWLAQTEHEKSGREAEWPTYAASRGWSAEKPHKFYGPGDIAFQVYVSAALCAAAIVALVYWLMQKNRLVRTDSETVFAPSGVRIPFTAITGLGKKKWDNKGLATVRYEIDGRKGEFDLDDYKYDRDATHQILAEIEEKLVRGSNQ